MKIAKEYLTVVIINDKDGWKLKPSLKAYRPERFTQIKDAVDRAHEISKKENVKLAIVFENKKIKATRKQPSGMKKKKV